MAVSVACNSVRTSGEWVVEVGMAASCACSVRFLFKTSA